MTFVSFRFGGVGCELNSRGLPAGTLEAKHQVVVRLSHCGIDAAAPLSKVLRAKLVWTFAFWFLHR
jgi:hypothetical protein